MVAFRLLQPTGKHLARLQMSQGIFRRLHPLIKGVLAVPCVLGWGTGLRHQKGDGETGGSASESARREVLGGGRCGVETEIAVHLGSCPLQEIRVRVFIEADEHSTHCRSHLGYFW